MSRENSENGVTNSFVCAIIEISDNIAPTGIAGRYEKRHSMTYAEIRKRGARRRRYILLLVLLIGILVFAVAKIVLGTLHPQTVPAETPPGGLILSAEETTETTEASTLPAITDAPAKETLPAPTKRSSEGGTIHVKQPYLYLRVNHTKKIPLILSNSVTADQITWSVDDPDILDVEQDGTVTGLQRGTCTICASYGDETLEIPVTVRELITVAGCTYVDDILVANKTYSLPPDYDPGLLSVTREAFDQLSADAAEEGLNIYEGSGYRDYKFQETCYNSMVRGYNKQYADTWSARPGHSEHQTGYTIDCNTKNEAFGNTDEGKWLAAHCHEYGFIIRYPKGKETITGYNYEAWHIRYVGKTHARIIHDQDITLEEYLDIDSAYHDGDPDASLLGDDDTE